MKSTSWTPIPRRLSIRYRCRSQSVVMRGSPLPVRRSTSSRKLERRSTSWIPHRARLLTRSCWPILALRDSINGLAYLNGEVVAQAAASNKLYFIDPFENTLNATVTTTVSLVGGLAGAGSRGTLFAVESGGDIVEINPADGSVINSFAPPFSAGIGLAFIEGYLWVGDAAGQVSKVDPDTGTEVASWSTTICHVGAGW